MTLKRVLMVAAVLLALVECVTLGFVGLLVWAFREGLFAPSPPDVVARDTRLALALTAVTVLNLIAIAVFLARSSRYGWLVLSLVQAGDALIFGVWLLVTTARDSTTILILSTGATVGVATMAILLGLRYARARGPTL